LSPVLFSFVARVLILRLCILSLLFLFRTNLNPKAAVTSARAEAIAEAEATFQARLEEATQRATELAMATVWVCN